MGQVADVIKGLEAKLTEAQNSLHAATANIQAQLQVQAQLNAQLSAAQANQLDDLDKAAITEAQGILNPPAAAPAQ